MTAGLPENPFPGPLAYRRDDHEYFFGRMDEIEELTSFVLSSSATLLYAPSGTGKSSLVQAGVAPHLEREFGVAVLPIVYLGGGIRRAGEGPGNEFVRVVCETIGGATPDLAAAAAAHRDTDDQLVLLVLDQFEEVFTDEADWQQRDEFFVILKQTLATHSWLRVVIALRSDYLAELVPHEQNLPGNLVVRYQLEPLTRTQAADAIGSAFEATAVELADLTRVLDLLTGDPRLPGRHGKYVNTIQLQIVCRRLWQERALPGGSGSAVLEQDSLFTLSSAIVRFVDEAIAQVVSRGGTDEVTVRWWLRHRLITPSGRRAFVQVEEEHTAGLANPVVTALAEVKLLQLEKRHGTRLAELTHDSMARGVLDSTEAWLKVRNRRRRFTAGALFAVFVVLLAGFTFLRLSHETPLLDRSGTIGHDEVLASFQATNSAAVIHLYVPAPQPSLRLTARSADRTVLGAASTGAAATDPDDRGAEIIIPTESGATYTVSVEAATPAVQGAYQLVAWGLPRATVTDGRVTDAPAESVVDLGRNQIKRLSVGDAYLRDLAGVRVLATDEDKEWAVVDTAGGTGFAEIDLGDHRSGIPSAGSTIEVESVPAPVPLKVGERTEVSFDGTALVSFSAPGVSGPLGLEGRCGGSVLPSPVDTDADQSTSGLVSFDDRGQTLPLPSRKTDQRILLTQRHPSTGHTVCTMTIRAFTEPKLGAAGIREFELGPDSPAKGYDVTPGEDTVFSTAKLPKGLEVRLLCPASGEAITNERVDRLLALVPARVSCTLWLSRGENAPAEALRLAVRTSPATGDGGG